ncbi:hypothetical protein AcW1_005251 [Taiwanofungus camphoratus]|nr:hypothetical protein AcW2_004021 [Antrodia cinnamomea]KAI0956616.1 hypothetical protein AcW1_005251 [Antrodia cinnamomea]
MNRLALTICSRCRHDLFRLKLTEKKILARARSGSSAHKKTRSTGRYLPYQHSGSGSSHTGSPRPSSPPGPSILLRPEDVSAYLGQRVHSWSKTAKLSQRLCKFGIVPEDIPTISGVFVPQMQQGKVIETLEYDDAQLSRMAYDLSLPSGPGMSDRYLTKILFEWAAHPTGANILAPLVSPGTLATMSELFKAADLSQPVSWFPMTRAARPRKIIMHVGPTNSGKTHNALRALAAARTGVYAGPLRLLAHEIWERLNKGQIIPLGVESKIDAAPDTDSGVAIGDGKPVSRKEGSKEYARSCNMLTGEEQKIVADDALLSCTVEMVPLHCEWDVAVVDEIQMIADGERGGSWTSAVLGLNAAELHLCGEETAVPLIQSMVRDTGDELIVKRYDRLSPLSVAEESLEKDLALVQEGDCIVTFSRSRLFKVKSTVEKLTGKRCAVVYGRLPPEIRSEQAALFNRQDSGYDVIIGSDAIGMGLNLKIKRVIFSEVRKFNGTREVLLSNSQIKQIAGRAGRFGMHAGNSSAGVVTTFKTEDLPIVRRALAAPWTPLRYSRIPVTYDSMDNIMRALPSHAATSLAADVYDYVAKLHPAYEFQDITLFKNKIEFVDVIASQLSLRDQVLLQLAPVPHRDAVAVNAIRCIMTLYRTHLRVGLREALKTSGLWDSYQDILTNMRSRFDIKTLPDTLATLESIHKTLVAYLWLSYRLPVAFPDQGFAFQHRGLTEKAMDQCLEKLTTVPRHQWKAQVQTDADEEIKFRSAREIRQLRAEKSRARQNQRETKISLYGADKTNVTTNPEV